MKKNIIAVDLGATVIKSAIVLSRPPQPSLLNEINVATERSRVLDQLFEIVKIQKCFAEQNGLTVGGIGLGIPGVVNRNTGMVKHTLNLKMEGQKIKHEVESKFRLPVLIDSDRNLGALGELYYGKARRCRNVVCVSWGTGVACSLIIEGKVYRGSHGVVTELGHTCVNKNGVRCKCGNNGCLGRYSGSDALVNQLAPLLDKKGVKKVPPHKVIKLSLNYLENKNFSLVFERAINYLAIGLANICNIIDPEKVIIWGGLSNLPKSFFATLENKVRQLSHPAYRRYLKIELAKYKEKSGMYGAFALFDQM